MQNVILQPIEVGGQTFKNRIMFPPVSYTHLSRYRSLGGTIFMTVMVMVGPLFLYVDN